MRNTERKVIGENFYKGEEEEEEEENCEENQAILRNIAISQEMVS